MTDLFVLNDQVELVKDQKVGQITAIERILPNKKRQSGKFDHTKPNNFEFIYSVIFEDNSIKRVYGFQIGKKA